MIYRYINYLITLYNLYDFNFVNNVKIKYYKLYVYLNTYIYINYIIYIKYIYINIYKLKTIHIINLKFFGYLFVISLQ